MHRVWNKKSWEGRQLYNVAREQFFLSKNFLPVLKKVSQVLSFNKDMVVRRVSDGDLEDASFNQSRRGNRAQAIQSLEDKQVSFKLNLHLVRASA